jgi:hypothetical protein
MIVGFTTTCVISVYHMEKTICMVKKTLSLYFSKAPAFFSKASPCLLSFDIRY